jgi:hypothetical protein
MAAMDKQSRRDAARDFKERKVPRGVFAVRCAAAGQAWVSASRNLDSEHTKLLFSLKHGGYINREVQAAWNAHGEAAVTFEILEVFDDEDMGALGRADLAKSRAAHWRAELGAAMLVG